VIRRRDWDEFQDYFKLVRFIRYGHKREPVYLLLGQLWGATIGHGTLVNRYANSLSLDHTKFGLALDLNGEWGGIETMTDSVVSPMLLAARAYVRPLAGSEFLPRWAVGFTAATDRTAPRSLSRNPDGSIEQDAQGNPAIAVYDSVWAAGIDTEFEVVRNSILSVIPYVDLNRIAGAGNGVTLEC
jgi:hypothetical protein